MRRCNLTTSSIQFPGFTLLRIRPSSNRISPVAPRAPLMLKPVFGFCQHCAEVHKSSPFSPSSNIAVLGAKGTTSLNAVTFCSCLGSRPRDLPSEWWKPVISYVVGMEPVVGQDSWVSGPRAREIKWPRGRGLRSSPVLQVTL